MKRVALLGMLVALTVSSATNADITPLPVEACGLLPVGSPCTLQGREDGVCAKSGAEGVCQLRATPDSVPSTLPATSATSSLPPPSSPKSGGGCAVTGSANPDLVLVSMLLLFGYRMRQRRYTGRVRSRNRSRLNRLAPSRVIIGAVVACIAVSCSTTRTVPNSPCAHNLAREFCVEMQSDMEQWNSCVDRINSDCEELGARGFTPACPAAGAYCD
jgi:hypothetical protein